MNDDEFTGLVYRSPLDRNKLFLDKVKLKEHLGLLILSNLFHISNSMMSFNIIINMDNNVQDSSFVMMTQSYV